MNALTVEQQALKTKIRTSAVIWSIIAALVVALIVFLVAGNAADWLRWGLTIVLGAGAGFLVYRNRYNSGVAKAVCKKCGTAFGIREVERREEVLGTEQRRKIEPIRASEKTGRPLNKVTTWTEQKVEIIAVEECFNCHDRTERKWTVTRDADKLETEVPA